MPGILSLTGRDGDHLHPAVRESSVDQCREQSEESTSGAIGDIRFHRTWMVPVAESQPVAGWPSAEVDNKGEDDQADDGKNLDACEAKLSFAVNRYGEDVEAYDEDDDQRYPRRHVDAHGAVPVLNDNGCRRDFGAERDRGQIPVLHPKTSDVIVGRERGGRRMATHVPSDSKPHRSVDVSRTELWDGAG